MFSCYLRIFWPFSGTEGQGHPTSADYPEKAIACPISLTTYIVKNVDRRNVMVLMYTVRSKKSQYVFTKYRLKAGQTHTYGT